MPHKMRGALQPRTVQWVLRRHWPNGPRGVIPNLPSAQILLFWDFWTLVQGPPDLGGGPLPLDPH